MGSAVNTGCFMDECQKRVLKRLNPCAVKFNEFYVLLHMCTYSKLHQAFILLFALIFSSSAPACMSSVVQYKSRTSLILDLANLV